eukprot:561531-Hanusia_phi.AAC.1
MCLVSPRLHRRHLQVAPMKAKAILYVITQPVCSERPAGGPGLSRTESDSDWQAVASRRQSRTVRKPFHTS